MEDAAEALKMTFAVFAFVIALGLAFANFNLSKQVSDIVINANDRTYVESYADADINDSNGRTVGVETVIPTLYRYYKEKYTVDIIGTDNNAKVLLDLLVERNYDKPSGVKKSDYYKGTRYSDLYPDDVTWSGSSTNIDAKLRVDSLVSNTTKKINGKDVKHNYNFDFNDLYYQTFEKVEGGKKKRLIGTDDNTYFIEQSGTTKMYISFTRK